MAACLQPDEGTYVSCIQLAVTCLQELEYPVVTDAYMFNQLDMVLKLLPEYAERAASKLRASGEHDALSNGPFNPTTDRPVSPKFVCMAAHITRSCVGVIYWPYRRWRSRARLT